MLAIESKNLPGHLFVLLFNKHKLNYRFGAHPMIGPLLKIHLLVLALVLSGCNAGADDSKPLSQDELTAVSPPEITVYKSPSCGCCKEWVTYLEEEGFAVTSIDHDNVDQIKVKLGLPSPELRSCHTATVDGYIVEGHVPASDIQRLLAEKPTDILGISAPGMPMMSPGMGSREPKDYDVLSFTATGETAVYSKY
jgi:hypothetical protein